MDWGMALSFLGVAVLLTLMPGPDILFVLAQSMTQGRNAGILIALGLCTGLLIHISAAALGISTLIYQSTVAFIIVKYAGAAYLIYLSWRAFRSGGGFRFNQRNKQSLRGLYRKGFIMNILNPKVSLFFLALLPQFVQQNGMHVPSQMMILGIIFLVQALIIFTIVSICAAQLRAILLRNSRLANKLHWIEGTLLGLIGLKIATDS